MHHCLPCLSLFYLCCHPFCLQCMCLVCLPSLCPPLRIVVLFSSKPPKKTRRRANVPLQSSTRVTWASPLITTPNHQFIHNNNLKSNLKLSHPSQQLPTLPMPALPMSRFAYPNSFSTLQSDPSDSDDDRVDDSLPLSSGLPLTTPIAFTFSLLCSVLRSSRSLFGTRCLTVVCVALVLVCPFAIFPPHCGLRMHRHLGPAV